MSLLWTGDLVRRARPRQTVAEVICRGLEPEGNGAAWRVVFAGAVTLVAIAIAWSLLWCGDLVADAIARALGVLP